MSTPQLRIEFSHSNGTTEAAVFDALPTWADLAARTQILFDIPETNAALAYVDADGDEITLSSEAELREFFSALPGNTDTTTVLFVVRDLRELRASEDSDRTMSTPPASPRGDRPGDENADAQFRGPEVFLMRGMFAAHGRGGARGGRGAGRGGFGGRHLHGPHFGHIHHHHGPPSMFAPYVPLPPFVGPPRRGEPFDNTNQGVPSATISREIPRAHSAPPEVHANHPAPQDRIEFTNLPSTRASLHGGCDRGGRSGHHRHHEYPYSPFFGHGRGRGSAFDMRGGRGRGCTSRGRGFGGPAHFGSFPHEFFPGMPGPPFGFGGRGRRGFAARGRGMSFEGPRAVVMGVGI